MIRREEQSLTIIAPEQILFVYRNHIALKRVRTDGPMNGEERYYFSHGTSDAWGVMILFNPKYRIVVNKVKADLQGRILMCDVLFKGLNFSIANIYAPNKDDPAFFLQCFSMLQDFNEKVIIAGDFNLVLNPVIDSKNVSNNNKSAATVNSFMEEAMFL